MLVETNDLNTTVISCKDSICEENSAAKRTTASTIDSTRSMATKHGQVDLYCDEDFCCPEPDYELGCKRRKKKAYKRSITFVRNRIILPKIVKATFRLDTKHTRNFQRGTTAIKHRGSLEDDTIRRVYQVDECRRHVAMDLLLDNYKEKVRRFGIYKEGEQQPIKEKKVRSKSVNRLCIIAEITRRL